MHSVAHQALPEYPAAAGSGPAVVIRSTGTAGGPPGGEDHSSTVPRPTSRAAWVLLVLADLALSAAAVPGLVGQARSAIPADLAAEIGNPGLIDTAVRVGAYLSVPIHGLTLIVFALVAGSLERHLAPASVRISPRLAIGAGWVLVAVTAIPLRLLTVAAVAWRSLPVIGTVCLLAVAGAALLARDRLRSMSPGRRALFLGASSVFVLAMTVGK